MAAPQQQQQIVPPPPASFAVLPASVLADPVFAAEPLFQAIIVAGQLDLPNIDQALLRRLFEYKQQRARFVGSAANLVEWEGFWLAVDSLTVQWSKPTAYPTAGPGIGATLLAINTTLQQVQASIVQMQGNIAQMNVNMLSMNASLHRARNHSLGAEMCRLHPLEPVPSHVDGRVTPLALPDAAPITSFQALRAINTIANLTQWCDLYQIPVPANGPPPERKKAMQRAIWTYITGYTDGWA